MNLPKKISDFINDLSKPQKLRLTLLLFVCALVSFAIGVATNLFAQPIFSEFYFVSYETAHTIVIYTAIGVAVALAVTGLSMSLLRKQKILRSTTASTKEPSSAEAVIVAKLTAEAAAEPLSDVSLETGVLSEVEESEESESAGMVQQEIVSQTAENQAVERDGKLICPHCKNEFTRPIYTLDFAGKTPKLRSSCPYCNQPVKLEEDKKQEQEDLWNKTFKNSKINRPSNV